MSGRSLVLLCPDLQLDLPSLQLGLGQRDTTTRFEVLERPCGRPDRLTKAVRAAAATRVVAAVCARESSPAELRTACLRGGAEPFGVELLAVEPDLPPDTIVLLVDAALAKLRALREGDRGRPAISDHGVSRRGLFSLAGMLTHEPVALIDDSRCLGVARCGLCVETCPEAAIVASGDRLCVRASGCDACGRCVPACPAGAAQIAGSSTAQIEAQLRVLVGGGSRVALACARALTPPEAGWLRVELPSLAMASAGWLLQLLAHGACDVRVEPCDGDCCREWRDGRRESVERLRAFLPSPPALDAEGLTLTEPAATAASLRSLVPASTTAVLEDVHSPLGRLECDRSSCTLCGACVTSCPTAALVLNENGEEAVLRHERGCCVGCGHCVGSCPEGSLQVRRGFDLAGLRSGDLELHRGNRDALVQERVEQLLAGSP